MTERKIINGLGYYPVPSGDFYPSVTTILNETKPEADKLALIKWRESVGEERAMEGATRGTEIHTLCENYFNRNSEIYAEEKVIEVSPLAAPYWGNMKQLLKRTTPTLIEEFVYHDELKYAGRFDCYGCFDDRENLIVDFKTASKPKKKEWITDYFIQTAAYAMAIEATLVLPVQGVAILMASPERPQIFMLDLDQLKIYEEKWKQRLEIFYTQNPVVLTVPTDN